MSREGIASACGRALEEYLADCGRRGYSEKTLASYRTGLTKFFLWLADTNPGLQNLSEISRDAIADYQMFLYKSSPTRRKKKGKKGDRLALESQYHFMGVVLWFFRWATQQEKILMNPCAGIQLPKRPQRIPRNYLSLREVEKLLRAPDLETHIGLRDRAMLEVFYTTGIRAGELRKIKTDDLNLPDGWLTIRQGKGGKDRVVPLGKAAVHFLSVYLEKTRPILASTGKHSVLFVNRYGGPLSHESINKMVQKAARAAGIKRTITPHCIRHTCATLMLRGHADIRHIQELLGHSCLSSTQIYTRVEIGDLKKVHQKCHPREKQPIDSK